MVVHPFAERVRLVRSQPVKVVDVELRITLKETQRTHKGNALSGLDEFTRGSQDHAVGSVTIFDAPALRITATGVGGSLVTIVAE